MFNVHSMPATAKKSNLRIVYLLALSPVGELECTVHTTKLMKWDAFNQAPMKFEGIFGTLLADVVDDSDRKIGYRLRMSCKARYRDLAVLSGAEGYDLFQAIVATRRAFWSTGSHLRLKWESAPMPVKLDWRVVPGEYRPILLPSDPRGVILPLSPPVHVIPEDNSCGPVTGPMADGLLARWGEAKTMDADRARTFCLSLLNRFPGATFPIPGAIEIKEAESAQIIPELTLSRRASATKSTGAAARLNEMVLVELQFRYGKRRIERDSELDHVSYSEGDSVVRMPRDRSFEGQCEKRLRALGFEPAPSESFGELLCLDAGGFLLADKAPTSWEDLLDQVFPKLETEGWKIVQASGFRLSSGRGADLYSEVKSEQSWFEYTVGIEFNGMRVPVVDMIRDFIRSCQSDDFDGMLDELEHRSLALALEDGEFLVLPGQLLRNILAEVFELLGQRTAAGDTVRLSRWRVAELSARGFLELDAKRARELPDLSILLQRLKGGLQIERMEPPAALRAELRDYQKVGLGWLQFLRESGTHGVLADDMGLGKTLQTIACLLVEHEAGRLDGSSLIVAPTSVLENWQSEIERFAPDLVSHIYHGSDREALWEGLPKGGIIITTYAVLRNDVERLQDVSWNYLIVDEAQFIKNAASLSARCLCQLNARHKLCLTGTPIENRLSELWSLFNFLMPDFLGGRRIFQQTYARGIEDGGSDGKALAERLKRRISPFLLRRTKELVARELPAKTQIVRPVELLPEQAERYEAVRTAMNSKVVHELEARGLAQSRIVVLDALLKLRQICCDPRLYTKGEEGTTMIGSAKLEATMELIDNLLENGHRILLFSQFTSMLELIEIELKRRGTEYRILTGATRNRGELVGAFQAGTFPLFLISLKAGGTGLNLTAADTVIHYDPWWNPAAEAQATDRSHRIGQDKPVFVYKLIAENTVEAKILELQKKKGRLAASLLDENATGSPLDFTEDDIRDLFA